VTLPFRIKLFLASMALVLAGLAAADRFVSGHVERSSAALARADFERRVALALEQLEPGATPSPADCARLGLALRGELPAFVRLLGGDDEILVKGAAPPEGLSFAPRDAPEIATARGGQSAARVDLHESPPRLFAAVPLPLGADGHVLQIVRALPEVEAATIGVQRILGRGLVLALLVVALVTFGGPRLVARDVGEVTQTAQRMSKGDLSVRVQLDGGPYSALGRALDQLAENLSGTVTQLRDERDLLGRILESMEEGVLVLDDQRRIVLLNRALSSMLLVHPLTTGRVPQEGASGGSPLDVAGKSILEITLNPNLDELLDHAIARPPRATKEIDVGDLKPRRLLVRATRLTGAPWGFLLVFVDVTEVRRLESLRRDFVANVSHELRTPVAAVRSAAETLRSAVPRDPAAADRFLGIIERNAGRLQSLVEDLLDLSRIESREYRLNLEPLDPTKIVADVLGLFRERAEARHIELRTSVSPGLPQLTTDRRALEQVLVNLVDNAVKYVPESSSIIVGASRRGDNVEFTVADTGAGIDAVHLPRLFERFYRVDPGRSRDRGGSGLGLAIVKHLVEAMAGTVSVESKLGRGTVFHVDLPLRHPRAPAAPARADGAA
jgi:two-component system phosphate regulon sensor histidine kinase PhoR